MYTPGPSAEECAAIGIRPEDVTDNTVTDIWEENWDAYLIFSRMRTQWRSGMAGPTGLDYTLFDSLCERFGVKKRVHQLEVLDKLQVMEDAALTTMAKEIKK